MVGLPGEWIDISDDGSVYIDGILLEEPYLTEKVLGECNIELPIRCRMDGILLWEITAASPATREMLRWGVLQKNRS